MMVESPSEIFLAVPAERMAATEKFYTEVLGLMRDRSDDSSGSIVVMIGDQRIQLLEQAEELRERYTGISLQVHGFSSLIDHLAETGFLPSSAAQTARRSGRLEISDPAGNIITLADYFNTQGDGR